MANNTFGIQTDKPNVKVSWQVTGISHDVYGILVIATLGLLRPDWLNWYGVNGWLSLPTSLET